MPSSDQELRRAYEELARRAAEERLAFADRVQEVLDQAQHLQGELDTRDAEIGRLEDEAAALRSRVEELDDDLRTAHDQHRTLESSRSVRYTAPLRGLASAFRRR